jgi:hypothetical protein
MAYTVRDWWVLSVIVTDDSQGKQTRQTKIGIPYDTVTPDTADTWAQTLSVVEGYILVLEDITDGEIVGWSLTRSTYWTGAHAAPTSSDLERKGTFNLVASDGRKSSIQVPSVDESIIVASGQAGGLYIDEENADVVAYLAALVAGNLCLPNTGTLIGGATAGKKLHVRSGVVKARVG